MPFRRRLQISLPTVPTLRQYMLSVINRSTHCMLSLDPRTLTLTTFYWPVHGTERVTPDALHVYRRNHQFLGPCCLCPLLRRPLTKELHYFEAAIYVPTQGRYKGEWVAECAEGKCGYLVLLESVYPKRGLPVKRYPLRDTFTPCPPPCLHRSEKDAEDAETRSSQRPLKRTYAQADLNDAPSGLGRDYETDWRKIVKLDRLEQPGLSEKEFVGLFAKCEVCGLIVARLVFHRHHCKLLGEDGLELTDCEEQ